MRIVIELTKAADPEGLLQDLYKHTPMQSTVSLIMLALVDGEPRLLSLKQALRVYLDHRLVIIRRRTEHDLEKARQRAHILEGLRIALLNLDEVIAIIRKAPDVETARMRLIKRFRLSDIQAQAILDMQLRRLAALERKKIEEEYKELQALIRELVGLLRSQKRISPGCVSAMGGGSDVVSAKVRPVPAAKAGRGAEKRATRARVRRKVFIMLYLLSFAQFVGVIILTGPNNPDFINGGISV
jgi:hypothetical protein